MKRIFSILIIWAVIIVGAAWYIYRAKAPAVKSGYITVRNQTPGKTGPAQAVSANQPATTKSAVTPQDAQTQAGQSMPPVSDSISRNPPNGMIFAGSGKYQIYRQGDLTWRINTDTGDACVLFATDAQWRLQRVYQHGCSAS
ncbi:MAG TPA: hypothetical protein VMQ60_12555 [Acidobacteriaceae bacterium]|jgi:hypothetical protein|nr:hypothetical protein [Acidobacteriaceae bacterium]